MAQTCSRCPILTSTDAAAVLLVACSMRHNGMEPPLGFLNNQLLIHIDLGTKHAVSSRCDQQWLTMFGCR